MTIPNDFLPGLMFPFGKPDPWPAAITMSELLGGSAAGAAAGSGVTIKHETGAARLTMLNLVNVSVPIVDGAASGGGGGLKIFDFPEGVLLIPGASTNLTVVASSTVTTGAVSMVAALGTAAANAASTLSGTEANIIASTAATLAARAGSFTGKSTATEGNAAYFDGHSSAVDLYLNFGIPDANISADATVTVNGTISFAWLYLGDF
jgi:hypothetical protein